MFFFSSGQPAGFGLRTANERRSIMQSTMVNIYEAQVLFDANTKTFVFAGDVLYNQDGAYLKIAMGVHAIIFSLETIVDQQAPEKKATFQDNPITWYDPNTLLSNSNDTFRCCLVISNLNSNIIQYGFEITVHYDDHPYTSDDPTIINDPIVGGSG
jgi:hypothetical protein